MARQQTFNAYPTKVVAASATPEKLYATTLNVKSVVIEALYGNTDFVYIGDASNQNYALAPGKAIEIHGDNLDNGCGAYLDLSTIYVRVGVNGEGVSFMTLNGL